MSDLRDRIAAVMHDHLLHRGFHVECACGWVSQEPGRTTVDHDAHVADAVIRELIAAMGLRHEHRGWPNPERRWVSDWKADDE